MVTTRCAGAAAGAVDRLGQVGARRRVRSTLRPEVALLAGFRRRRATATTPRSGDQVAQRRQQPLAFAGTGRGGRHRRGVLEPGHLDGGLGDARRRQRRHHRLAGHAERCRHAAPARGTVGQPVAALEDVATQRAGGERDVAQLVERHGLADVDGDGDHLGRTPAARSDTARRRRPMRTGTTIRSMGLAGLTRPPVLRTAARGCGRRGDRG